MSKCAVILSYGESMNERVFTRENKIDLMILFSFVLIVGMLGLGSHTYLRQEFIVHRVPIIEGKVESVLRRLDEIEHLIKAYAVLGRLVLVPGGEIGIVKPVGVKESTSSQRDDDG